MSEPNPENEILHYKSEGVTKVTVFVLEEDKNLLESVAPNSRIFQQLFQNALQNLITNLKKDGITYYTSENRATVVSRVRKCSYPCTVAEVPIGYVSGGIETVRLTNSDSPNLATSVREGSKGRRGKRGDAGTSS